jgi:Fe-S cluster assembly ATP-binding protein
MLSLKNITTKLEDTPILHSISLDINEGECHVLMGPNGAGKSTLARVLMGDPKFPLTSQSHIYFKNSDLVQDSPQERSQKGIFMTFQAPIQIPGLKVFDFLKLLFEKHHPEEKLRSPQLRKMFKELCLDVGLDTEVLKRHFNVGFSGGERKKLELLQILVASPRVAILDELDSGLDLDGQRQLGEIIKTKFRDSKLSLLIITHSQKMAELSEPDRVHILKKGKIVLSDGPHLLKKLDAGFADLFKGEENEARI